MLCTNNVHYKFLLRKLCHHFLLCYEMLISYPFKCARTVNLYIIVTLTLLINVNKYFVYIQQLHDFIIIHVL